MQEEFLKITKDTKRAHEHFLNDICYHIAPIKLHELIKEELNSFNLVDVRKYEDYIEGHIPYAIHVPPMELEENMNKFSKEKVNIVYAGDIYCLRAKLCAAKLAEHGYPVMELNGGFRGWEKYGYDVIKESAGMG